MAYATGGDRLADSYHASFGTPVVTLRPFNTFGPRQSARAFIPTIISQALAGGPVRLGSLTPERDMTFVADTVAGFLAAAVAPAIEGETINLGTGETHSVGWFAERLLALMGVDTPIVQERARMRPEKSEVLKLVSDNTLARLSMDWAPRMPLDEGLRRTIGFFREHRIAADEAAYVR